MREHKRPSQKLSPSDKKEARGIRKAEKHANAFCTWDTTCIDCDGKWSWINIDPKTWWDHICPSKTDFQKMKWSEIKGPRHHAISVSKIIPQAQQRLNEIRQDDIDTLFSFAVGSLPRIWGIKDRNIFRVLWWDPNHEICPSFKSHT